MLPTNNAVIHNANTFEVATDARISSPLSSVALLSTIMTKTMMQAKSPYDIIMLYGAGASHNIAVSLSVLNIPAICPNNGRKNAATEYKNKTKIHISCSCLESISDDKSLSIFQLIANVNSDKQNIIKKLSLSTKQYYSKTSAMGETGLEGRVQDIILLVLIVIYQFI